MALVVGLATQMVSATPTGQFIPGNPACDGAIKIEPVANGTYNVSFGGFAGTITITTSSSSAGQTFAFTTDSPFHVVTSVIVKGGPNALLYTYSPGVQSDSGLHAPLNSSNGKWYGLSHLCFFTAKLSG